MRRPDAANVARDVGVVIVAAGHGTRAGGTEPKQFRWVAGKPMLLHSVHTFMERADVLAIVCVLPQRYAGDPPPWLFQSDLDRLVVSVGGRTRTESVFHGLEDLPDAAKVVVVHDAARPLVGQATIDRVVAEARAGRVATAALPVVDTLKEVSNGSRVTRTVPRDQLWRAQTPQGFPRDVILRAHTEARRRRVTATDDVGLCEEMGHEVVVVRGSERAMKVTDEEDFARVEALFPLAE
ncbi:MAG: 2-C-methyl-D-erythritol 4-phosphate cytidylyltransferase [Gemmatimonadota bacterium]|nr:2-C-methyl-D-erythritol 4-phosphate cytidylyltransferase [Gemmatimonadota bacterium]